MRMYESLGHTRATKTTWHSSLIRLCSILCLLVISACGKQFDDMPDMAAIDDVSVMKETFYDYLTPIVEHHNKAIAAQRADVITWQQRLETGKSLGWLARRKLRNLAGTYELDPSTPEPELVAELSLRVDIIPPALALAQAAIESGWGRSRFAATYNNLFGQWCYTPGCGVIPKRRPAGMSHEVAKFDSVSESVRRYMNNLNTHDRYRQLRALRQQARSRDEPVTASLLTPGLLGYSERGQAYVDEVNAMIRRNQGLLKNRQQ